ncbi:MAG: enoyl-CoA hydratase [Rhodobacterales bacterium]|nr:MAG: enoyl-CoA hydratase [Rhodobacterales bacterium]
MPDLLTRADDGGIATLTLTSPANLNALSRAMLLELDAALTDLARDDQTRVVILRAEGRNFCAGHDLKEIQGSRTAPDHGAAEIASLFALCARVMQSLTALPQPTIASVQGVATAAGCQLACSCDLIVAADTARFGVNGINIGLFCTTPMVALTRKLSPAATFELLATGDFLPAARAHALGLVNRLSLPDQLDATTRALAETLATKLPSALRLGKRAFQAQHGLALDQAYATVTPLMVDNALAPDTTEGIQAFLDRRPPNWP